MRISLVFVVLFFQLNNGAPRPKLQNITTATVTTVKASAGQLHSLTVNNPGGNPCTAVIYDSTTNSGTKIATVDCTSGKQSSYEVDIVNGITIDTSQDSQPADLTVSFN